MNKTLRVPDYLGHIPAAIERIERHTADVDLEMVWRTVCNDLPDLYRQIKALSD